MKKQKSMYENVGAENLIEVTGGASSSSLQTDIFKHYQNENNNYKLTQTKLKKFRKTAIEIKGYNPKLCYSKKHKLTKLETEPIECSQGVTMAMDLLNQVNFRKNLE